jgi:lysophospholipase L1-like esterase
MLQSSVRAQAAPIRIMPLGDSITDGYNVPGGYRIGLEDDLVADDASFDFVGSLANGPSVLVDQNHEGHSGFRVDQITASIGSWLTSAQPDVVLLMIGTNDVIQNYQLATATNRLGTLLDQIHTARPQAHILVASIPPLPGSTDDQQVRAYNAAIPGLVQSRSGQGWSITYVEMHNALTTADLADGVHPSASGYSKIADVWHVALIPILGSNQTPSATLTAPTAGATIAADADVVFAATASDADGSVARVEFLANGSEVGEDASAPYGFTWVDPPAGGHTLSARAVDNVGATGSSAPVPITVQSPPGGSSLYRAINLGGSAMTIDGVPWEAGTAANVQTTGIVYENQSIPVEPATSAARAAMLRSVIWGASVSGASLRSVPSGSYDVFVSIWEDNRSATIDVRVEGQLVRQGYRSGARGHWERLGPFRVSVSDGSLDVTAGPDANLSGLEVFAVGGS